MFIVLYDAMQTVINYIGTLGASQFVVAHAQLR